MKQIELARSRTQDRTYLRSARPLATRVYPSPKAVAPRQIWTIPPSLD